jgi:hypothetical protein
VQSEESEVIPLYGSGTFVFAEGEFDNPVEPTGDVASLVGPDALAYYLPYHFYCDGIWGIYIRAKGILELAAGLKGAPITHGSDHAVGAALISLFEHELFHCLTEQAATRAEVVVRSPVYNRYFPDSYAAFHEEAMANAYAHRKVNKRYPGFVTALEKWMSGQGRGYKDFHLYRGTLLGKGRRKCSQHIVRFAPPRGPLSSRLPSEFLFGRTGPASIPTYLVLDAEIAGQLLRPFQKYAGTRVWVHTREHPPPHIHVEMPPGTEVTRCEWPSLAPLKGNQGLKLKQRAKLDNYLQKFGQDICEKLRSVYQNPQLGMPAI